MSKTEGAEVRHQDKRKKGRVTKEDVIIGRNLRHYRLKAGLSQKELGAAIGEVSFQQVQKYEKGKNRIPAAKLYYAARALKTPMEYFFDRIMMQEGGVAFANDLTSGDIEIIRFLKLPSNAGQYSEVKDMVRRSQAGQ